MRPNREPGSGDRRSRRAAIAITATTVGLRTTPTPTCVAPTNVIAATMTGFVLLAVPDLGWQYQLLIFSLLSIVTITVFKRYQRAHPATTDQPALNRRGEQYIGRTFTLTEPIVNNNGVIRVDDSTWRITGNDLPAGATIRVVGAKGVILKIETVSD